MQGDSATRPCTRPPCGCTLGRSGGASLRIGGGELRYRPDIDGLRCVAIVAVLLAHADLGWFRGGYVGVDVFFVVSGFLITRILWPGPGPSSTPVRASSSPSTSDARAGSSRP